MTILCTRFVAIDSSTLNKLAKDLLGTDAHLRDHAASILDSLHADNWIPVITLHHLSEMVQHADPTLAVERLRFLRRFPLLAYVKPMDGHRFPATIVDIAAREVRAVISGARTLNEVITKVRDDLFNVATGEELISNHPDDVDMLRSQAIPQHDEQKIIASIARSDAGKNRHTKLKTMMAGHQRTATGRLQFAAKFQNRLKEQLMKHGDERLINADAVASEFALSMLTRIKGVPENDPFVVQRLLGLSGLSLSDVDPEMTVEDLGFLVNHRANLDIISDVLKRGRLSVQEVPQDLCPSWRLRREILRRQNAAARVKGSNLTDGYLLGLAFYADAIEVDKRTLDFVRQIALSDPEIAQYVKHCIKCSTYADLPARLRACNPG
jgi:hypothetical protein